MPCLAAAEVNLVNLERVGFNLRNFDMVSGICGKLGAGSILQPSSASKFGVEACAIFSLLDLHLEGPQSRCGTHRLHPQSKPGHHQRVADLH